MYTYVFVCKYAHMYMYTYLQIYIMCASVPIGVKMMFYTNEVTKVHM